MELKPIQATPPADLETQIMSCSVPKNEREWWAQKEVERLRAELEAANDRIALMARSIEHCGATRAMLLLRLDEREAGHDAAQAQLRAELGKAISETEDVHNAMADLRAELEAARAELAAAKRELTDLRVDLTEANEVASELTSRIGCISGEGAVTDLQRFGVTWPDTTQFLHSLMPDGYWTPWHLADEALRHAQVELAAERGRLDYCLPLLVRGEPDGEGGEVVVFEGFGTHVVPAGQTARDVIDRLRREEGVRS